MKTSIMPAKIFGESVARSLTSAPCIAIFQFDQFSRHSTLRITHLKQGLAGILHFSIRYGSAMIECHAAQTKAHQNPRRPHTLKTLSADRVFPLEYAELSFEARVTESTSSSTNKMVVIIRAAS